MMIKIELPINWTVDGEQWTLNSLQDEWHIGVCGANADQPGYYAYSDVMKKSYYDFKTLDEAKAFVER